MKTDTQHLLIVGITIILLALIYKNQFGLVEFGLGGLVGFLSQKTLTDKQSDTIEDMFQKEAETQ